MHNGSNIDYPWINKLDGPSGESQIDFLLVNCMVWLICKLRVSNRFTIVYYIGGIHKSVQMLRMRVSFFFLSQASSNNFYFYCYFNLNLELLFLLWNFTLLTSLLDMPRILTCAPSGLRRS